MGNTKNWISAFIYLLYGFSMIKDARGWAKGAPYKTCINLHPKHHHGHHSVYQQMTPTPYVIRLNQTTYRPGDVVEVRLTSEVGKIFRGFQVRAQRMSGDTEEVVGEFIDYPDDVLPQYWYRSDQDIYNCLSHRDNSNKTEIVVNWRAPSVSVGDIEFRCAFVHTFEEFWVSQTRASLGSKVPSTDEQYPAQISATFDPPINVDECGVSKGCFLYPSGCHGDSCDYAVTYKADDDSQTVHFEMMGKTTAYLSASFSHDIKMGNDNTVTCIKTDDITDFQHGFNPFYYNDHHLRVNFTKIQISRKADKLYCRFTRPYNIDLLVLNEKAKPPTSRVVNFDIRKPYFLHLAWGPLYPGTAVIGKHAEMPLISKNTIDFLTVSKAAVVVMPLEYSLHAVFGLLGWMTLSGIGIILARHYRKHLSMSILGTGAWFQLHRGIAFGVLACSVIAITIMFVYVTEWTKYATVHAIFGLVASGLCLGQISAGFFRPPLTSPKRPWFNWFHRIGGALAFVFAAVCTLLGFNVETINVRVQSRGVIVVAVWLVFHVVWDILLELIKCKNSGYFKANTDEQAADNAMSVQDPAEKSTPKIITNLELILLAIYVICDLLFFIICVIFLF